MTHSTRQLIMDAIRTAVEVVDDRIDATEPTYDTVRRGLTDVWAIAAEACACQKCNRKRADDAKLDAEGPNASSA